MSRKTKTVSFVLGAALAAVAGAAAAWIVFTGMQGTGGGSFGSPTTSNALTFVAVTPTGTNSTLVPGGTANAAYNVTNNAGASEVVSGTVVDSITSSVPACVSHVTFNTNAVNGTYAAVPVNPTVLLNAWAADASTPATCANATLTATLHGNTTP